MERVLSQDERIRRAEELYERRKMQNQSRTSATVNVEDTNNNRLIRKLIIQFILCLLIYSGFYAVKNIPNLVSQEVMYKISDILEYDINIQELYNNFNSYIKSEEEEKEESNTLIEETLSATDSAVEETDNIEEVIENGVSNEDVVIEENIQTEEKVEKTQVEESSALSQMEIDAEYIKANYSLIKPLEGEITSRYGIRNPTVPTVPKYHTGIDIARVTGTVIISAMEGTVELVSSEGDYGNHVKITNGEVSTLYAHCSKIYVKEGETISQGQEIAEVGATGNVTGPHLHFEIRRNNQYVDPDLVLQF